jgi:ribosomal protein S18 acetylase RimI-like enzyme
MMNTLVRKALASDLEALRDLSHRTISASYRSFLGDVAVDAFLGSGAADRYVEENISRCSVILLDGEVAGYAVCQENTVDLMMIDQAVHRRGLGTALLGRVEALLFQRYGELMLESFEHNENANAFYRKNGWVEVAKHVDVASGANKIVFRKSA